MSPQNTAANSATAPFPLRKMRRSFGFTPHQPLTFNARFIKLHGLAICGPASRLSLLSSLAKWPTVAFLSASALLLTGATVAPNNNLVEGSKWIYNAFAVGAQ